MIRRPTDGLVGRGPRHPLLHQLSPDFNQVAILNAARAGRLAIEARQATIQVQLRAASDLSTFEYLLDQIDAPARTVEFIAEQLVGRAGGVAETAMHAFAQNCSRFFALGRIAELWTEMRLHSSKTRVQASRIEYARRIEGLLELMMDTHEH